MARRKRRRKGFVHPVMRTAYGNRARNLKDTILSLLLPPPPPDTCQCGGTGCLRCRGADHLLCDGDAITYRHLMSYAQCAVSSDAPGPPVIYSVRQLSQRQIVRNTMELMRKARSSNSNLLCMNYDMHSNTSLSVELLSSSDWSLLLDRIGDLLMEYLLKHCSIFVPNERSIKGFIQVTGTQLTSLSMKTPHFDLSPTPRVLAPLLSGCTQTLSHTCQQVSLANLKAHVKRKREEIAEVAKDISSQFSVCNPHKRKRLHSWQRRKQHKLNNQNKACSQPVKGKDRTACFRCFMLQSAHSLPAVALIKRQYVFYNRWPSLALFPKKHILYVLKPNDRGASSLFKNIFGNAKDYHNFVQFTRCSHYARTRSKCLYHSSLALFKSLIRNAQRCRHRMLLHKHCYVNSLNKDAQSDPKVCTLSFDTMQDGTVLT